MKKYITVAALLAAGTALANAEEIVTTFTGALSTSELADIELKISGLDGMSGSVASLVSVPLLDTTESADLGLRTVEGDGTFFAPSTNVVTGAGWEAALLYTFSGETIVVSSVTLGVGIFSNGNTWQPNDTDRDFAFEVAVGGVTASASATVKGNGTATPGNGTITLKFDDAVTLTDSATLAITVKKGTSETQGCFLGLHSVSLSLVPEPSAFGLLAGVGALALTVSRRRRTKKA